MTATMKYVLLLGLFLLATLVGCTTTEPQNVARQSVTIDGYTFFLEDATTEPRLNIPFGLRVQIVDTDGQPVEGAAVFFDLDMQAMPMAVNRPVAEPQGDGFYQAEAIYNMSGEWDITVVATIEGEEYRAVFNRMVP